MDNVADILALGTSIGAGGATTFVVVRALVQAWQTHQTEVTRRKVTDARRDETLIPDLQDDFARQRKELWDEIHRMREDLNGVTARLDDALRRERECEARVGSLKAEVERLRRDVGRIQADTEASPTVDVHVGVNGSTGANH